MHVYFMQRILNVKNFRSDYSLFRSRNRHSEKKKNGGNINLQVLREFEYTTKENSWFDCVAQVAGKAEEFV